MSQQQKKPAGSKTEHVRVGEGSPLPSEPDSESRASSRASTQNVATQIPEDVYVKFVTVSDKLQDLRPGFASVCNPKTPMTLTELERVKQDFSDHCTQAADVRIDALDFLDETQSECSPLWVCTMPVVKNKHRDRRYIPRVSLDL